MDQVKREVSQRYDLKGSDTVINLDKENIFITTNSELTLNAVNDIIRQKAIKRNLSLKIFDYGEIEVVSGNKVKQSIMLKQGIKQEIAKRINNLDFFSEDYDDFSTSIFSEIITTNIDKEGRFLIPEELKLYADIKTEAAFFGQGYFFQIWEPEKGLKNTEDSRRRLLKEKKSLRMMLTQQK